MSEERVWLKNYPTGVSANIDADKYSSLLDFVNESVAKYSTLPAYHFMGKTMSYGELDKKSSAFGGYLVSRGLEPGDRIALMMPNMLQYPIALFGALKAGLIVVNTNPLYTPREMKHQFTDSGAKAIVIAENFAANLEKIIGETSIKTIILTSIGGMLGSLKGGMTNFVIRKVKRMVPKFNLTNTVSMGDAIKTGKKFTLPEIDRKPDDTIVLQYTGGTTGVSKGAMLTNRNLVANLEQMKAAMAPFIQEKEEISLCALPLYHIFAFTVNALGMMSVGGANILIPNARDLDSITKAFNSYKITIMPGVNTLFNGLLNNENFRKADFSSFKFGNGGGMAVQTVVAERWKEVTGVPLVEGYGMTESSPVATMNPLDGSGKLGCIGMPIPSTELRIVDEKGAPMASGEVGEIQIKGPQVMKGYYNRPEATQKTITSDGWLSTGDIGLMDEDGYFKIVDRKKDMILVSGFNVFPNEIEDVIAKHEKVLEVGAIGVPDEKSTEAVKIFLVKKDKSLDKDEIIAYCRENLTGYKVPKHVEFIKELPKSNVGKILRRHLREGNYN